MRKVVTNWNGKLVLSWKSYRQMAVHTHTCPLVSTSGKKLDQRFKFQFVNLCYNKFFQATTLNCSHSFCQYCINCWMKRKKECPVCRASITSHSRSIVLDNYIDKMVESLSEEMKQKRSEIVTERKSESR